MNFLEANRLVANFPGGPAVRFLLATSGSSDKLNVFMRAAGAQAGRSIEIRTLPFNTLGQAILDDAAGTEREVFVLFPWDLVPEADWRSGLPRAALSMDALESGARATVDRLKTRPNARFIYVPAALPPLFSDPQATARLAHWLTTLVDELRAEAFTPDVFSLGSFLANGGPFSSRHAWDVAQAIVARALHSAAKPCKVLITDLDNVMWHGVIGEDGIDGIGYTSEGVGFRHFLYQTFLAKLKHEGVLLAAVSRNDAELANAPFATKRMTLQSDDFVAIVASYNAKSSQVKQIASQLNLGLDSFVFVDDNPIEIQEVSTAIPEVHAVHFPAADDALPDFFNRVAAYFPRTVVTSEDADRTAMYRRRLEGMAPTDAEGADLTIFLRGLEMALTIHDRSRGDRTRAIQLINKTNQFNLNGERVTDDEVAALLTAGARLYTCTLSDRTGSHGEVLSCLIDSAGTIRSLVMSCRIFQRRVEHAFFTWLARQENPPRALRFAPTPRNEPIQQFLEDEAFHNTAELVEVDLPNFLTRHVGDLELFALTGPLES